MIKLDIDDEIIREVNLHTHAPSQMQDEVAKVKANIKRKEQTTTDTPQHILWAELRNTSQDAAANIPSTSTLRRNIRKAWEDNNVPHNPVTREDIAVLPEQYQNTVVGEPFVIYDSGVGDQEQIFIFSSEIWLQLLRESEHWYTDGTFKVCPEIFYQLYTIHGQRNGQIFPVFCLLPNKTLATYRRMLQQVFDRVGDNWLQDVLVDFERAVINAFHLIDETIDMKGCFYHLSSNIWKKVQHSGLQQRYSEDQEFALHTRMLSAVAFMPPDNVIAGFEELSDMIRDTYQGAMDELLDYFEETYIGRYRRNAERRTPLFALNLSNMFH